MTPLRPPLRPVSLANRYFGYIVTVILKGYAKADLGKEITRSCKASITLWWSVHSGQRKRYLKSLNQKKK